MKDKIAKLIDLKSIITILITIFTFYFAKKEKGSEDNV